MFEFKGNLSKECQDFLYNKQRKLELISLGSVCGIFSILIIVLSVLLHPVCLIFFFLIAFILVTPFLPITKKSFLQHMPKSIVFNFSEDTVFYKSNKSEYSDRISDIEKIYDYGNFYHIKFKRIPDSYYILQKSLITQGTIDKFEECFKDKILIVKTQ